MGQQLYRRVPQALVEEVLESFNDHRMTERQGRLRAIPEAIDLALLFALHYERLGMCAFKVACGPWVHRPAAGSPSAGGPLSVW